MKSFKKMSPFSKRVALGKTIGFVAGLIAFIYLVYCMQDVSPRFAFGMLLWYMMTGVVVGAFGVMNKHPLFGWKMPWWLRGSLFGGFMFLILALVSYDALAVIMQKYGSWFVSPYWAIVDGIAIGMIVDFFATKFYGEGKKLFK